jgi:hypothetical protein
MDPRAEKVVMSEAELAKVLQAHLRRFVTGVRLTVKPNGEPVVEVQFAQQSLPLARASH